MYEVNIEGHLDDFLDWDTPLSEAHAEKLKGLVPGQMSIPSEGLDMGGGSRILPNHNRQVSNKPYPYILKSGDAEFGISEKDVARMIGGGETPTGQQVYARLSAALGGDPQATEALRKAGVPGIRYLDQGSRRAGTGTRNFVVFDDKLIDILRKYGLLPPIGAMALSQFARPRSEAR
jgi:hypothetical protein